MYCHANSKKGQYYAQIICVSKLEAHPFFFLNLEGTPSQENHKTIFSGLSERNWLCLVKVKLWRYFQQFAILCDTYIDFPQSVNSGKSIF